MIPFTLLIKPAGPDCNLACRYCFYSHKTSLFGPGLHRMTDHVLQKLISDYLALDFPISSFAWQGGEPTLMGLPFFHRALELQKQFGKPGRQITNALQTNGVLLDDSWCRFLHDYQFLVGISLDGPQPLHDHYRKDHAGRGSFDKVIAALDRCRSHRVEFNILVLLNDVNVAHPDELFDFFLDQKIKFLQFIPCVENDPQTGQIAPFSASPSAYGRFLCRLFDRWLEHGPEKISIRLFDSLLSYYARGRHTDCTFSPRCNDYVVIEHNGDVFCCDFFVTDEWKLGNLLSQPLADLFHSDRKRTFARLKRQVADQCLLCRHHPLCRGGCLKDRFVLDAAYNRPSYFCPAYRQFFDHAAPRLQQLAANFLSR